MSFDQPKDLEAPYIEGSIEHQQAWEKQEAQDEQRRLPVPELKQYSNVVKIYPYKDEEGRPTDYIIFETETQQRVPVHRRDVIIRAYNILNMLQQYTGVMPVEYVDKNIWLAHEALKAAIASARMNGLNYNTQAIKQFEDQIRQVERNWKNISIHARTSKTITGGFK